MDSKSIARFWSKVNKDGPVPKHRPELGPCWIWIASTDARGYGKFYHSRRMVRASRVAWKLAHGPVPPGEGVLHRCDNPPCVNNAGHLFTGTQVINMQDAVAKDRMASGARNGSRLYPESVPRGERHWHKKLTRDGVIRIRERAAAGVTQAALSLDAGISHQQVSKIVRRVWWGHVP